MEQYSIDPWCWRLWGRGRRGASEFLCRLSHQAYWLVPCAGSYLSLCYFLPRAFLMKNTCTAGFLHVRGYVCVPLELSVHTCLLFRAYQWGRSCSGSAFCSSDQTSLCGAVYRQEQPLVTLPSSRLRTEWLFLCVVRLRLPWRQPS